MLLLQKIDKSQARKRGGDAKRRIELRAQLGQPRRGVGDINLLDVVDLSLQNRQRRIMGVAFIGQKLLIPPILLGQGRQLHQPLRNRRGGGRRGRIELTVRQSGRRRRRPARLGQRRQGIEALQNRLKGRVARGDAVIDAQSLIDQCRSVRRAAEIIARRGRQNACSGAADRRLDRGGNVRRSGGGRRRGPPPGGPPPTPSRGERIA